MVVMAEKPLGMPEELLGWDSIPFKANSKSNVAKEATKRGGQTLLAPPLLGSTSV